MKINERKIYEVLEDLQTIIKAMKVAEKKKKKLLDQVDPVYQRSAQNLVRYSAFRGFDLRTTQKRLRNLGLTRFANAEGHISASILNTK